MPETDNYIVYLRDESGYLRPYVKLADHNRIIASIVNQCTEKQLYEKAIEDNSNLEKRNNDTTL